MVCEYIDAVLVIESNNFKDHLKALDRVIQRLAEAGFKLNAKNPSSDEKKLNILVSG